MKENQQGKNSNLHQAKREKNDEFYTQLSDIENELKHYREHFQGKIVFCNCDDPYESNFFKYFALNFNRLRLKKLIAIFEISGYEEIANKAYKIEVNQVKDSEEWVFDLEDIKLLIKQNREFIKVSPLKGNGDFSAGDFRSRASIKILQEADIVVTNPPFSLFREYLDQLVEYGKNFLILWNMNAITYKEVFPLIKENRLWTGYGFNMSMVYKSPYTNYLEANRKFVRSKGYDPNDNYIKVPWVCWYTNLEHKKRHEELILYKNYSPAEYPKYDNYDAINVNKVADIPCDYEGVMGVPITFLDKYNPDQFEIVWRADANIAGEVMDCYIRWFKDKWWAPLIRWVFVYKRILIRRK